MRRGDKLANESDIIDVSKYIDILLLKDKECKIVYLQTDDYSCYLEMQKYNNEKQLNLELLTLCDPNSRGTINNQYYKDLLTNLQGLKNSNYDYIKNNTEKLKNIKTLTEMNRDEIYKHCLDMIIGLDIVANSNICVLDYQSNVSRFIKLFHKTPKYVFDVERPNSDWNYNLKSNPAMTISYY